MKLIKYNFTVGLVSGQGNKFRDSCSSGIKTTLILMQTKVYTQIREILLCFPGHL